MACRINSLAAGSTCWVRAQFFDPDEQAVSPTAIVYSVHCLTTGATINAGASVTPAQSVDIPITSAENAMRLAENDIEYRRVVVTATHSGGDKHVEIIDYAVRAVS